MLFNDRVTKEKTLLLRPPLQNINIRKLWRAISSEISHEISHEVSHEFPSEIPSEISSEISSEFHMKMALQSFRINMTQFKTQVPEWRCFVVCPYAISLFLGLPTDPNLQEF